MEWWLMWLSQAQRRQLLSGHLSRYSGVCVGVCVGMGGWVGAECMLDFPLSLQFHNHMKVEVELLSAPEMSRDKRSQVTVVAPGDCYAVPIEVAQRHVFYVLPAGFGCVLHTTRYVMDISSIR